MNSRRGHVRCAWCAILTFIVLMSAVVDAAKPAARPKSTGKSAPAPLADTAATFDTLAGNLPSVLFAKKHPYLVVSDIYVPQGKRVGIDAGVVLLFKNFTSLHVMGSLSAKGTKEKPVVFTSVNDREYNPRSAVDPAPFDWNGIYIHEDGMGTSLTYCAIQYTVDGIDAKTRFVKLDPCLFLHNGKTNLTIEGQDHPVTEKPYYYSLTVNDPSLQGVPLAVLRDPKAPARNTLRFGGGGSALGGVIVGTILANRYSESSSRYRALSSGDEANLLNGSSAEWNRAKVDKNRDLAWMLVTFGLGVVGAVGLGVSFAF